MMKLPIIVNNLFKTYAEHGYDLYLVGGAVRDYLLNKVVGEYDFATTATVEDSLTFLTYDVVDRYQQALGSLKIKQGCNEFEITTMRIETGVKSNRYPEQTIFTDDVRLDALRRDFTINAIYYHPEQGFIDPLGGISDLNKGMIKFVKSADISIQEDPIRLIRALRFSHTLGFKIDDVDYQAMIKLAGMVNLLKQIKYSELYKIFSLEHFPLSLKKHLPVYLKSYPSLNQDLINQMIERNLCYSKYVMFLLFPKEEALSFVNNLNLSKDEVKLIKHLISFEKVSPSLINVKRLLRKIADLEPVLTILKPFDEAYFSEMMQYLNLIKEQHLCVDKKDLAITGQDLIEIGIPRSHIKAIIDELLEMTINDDSLNNREILLDIALKK